MGPFVIGLLFSLGVALNFPFFGFWILALLYLASYLVLFRMSPLERYTPVSFDEPPRDGCSTHGKCRYRVGDKGAEVYVVKEDDSDKDSSEMFVIGEADDEQLRDVDDDVPRLEETSAPLRDENHIPSIRPLA